MGDASDRYDAQASKVAFQSKELEELLNMIDKLRGQGISRFIDLPQMIVCGDQSSGKSSVLEAVSGVRFPTKDNLCTRFPTELILRRGPETPTNITIVPDASRTDDEKAELQAFKAGSEGLSDFGSIIDDASKAMGLDKNTKVFSNDVLRVELTGPALPHLTLVDLPGLFHSGNKAQSADDAEAVKALVTKYMEKSRSIILAVVSAKNDYANQIVTKFALSVDPNGERTLGIITKPDTLHAGSESEKQYFELAENKDVVLRLGWHVLRNRDYTTKDCSDAERNDAEADFFSKGIWTSLSPSQLGISSLKPRLSRVLKQQILKELPSLTKDVETAIAECESRLDRLGTSRATEQEQRVYLHQVSQDFCKIVQDAVAGHYSDVYFSDDSGSGYSKRIRAVVVNLLEEFADEMRLRGEQYVIVEIPAPMEEGETPIQITREDRLDEVAKIIRAHRGRELPGFTRPETITTLFKDQCRPWTSIVTKYTEEIYAAVREGLLSVLDHTSDQATKDGILHFWLNPTLDEIRADLDAKVDLNLQQHVRGHPITANHYFTENIQKLRNGHQADHLKKRLASILPRGCFANPSDHYDMELSLDRIIAALTNHSEADTSKFACSEALHFMQAYYKVALKFFVDDFCIHTIEQGLLDKLPKMFDPAKVLRLTDEEIGDIAGENEESRLERKSSSTKLAALKEAFRILRQLDRGRAKSKV